MEIDYTHNSFAGIPYRGTAVRMSDGDIASIIGATTGVVKNLAGAGAVGLGLALMLGGAILSAADTPTPYSYKSIPKAPKVPMGQTLVRVHTPQRDFMGFCIDDTVKFECEGNSIIAPTSVINRIMGDVNSRQLVVELIDGAMFQNVRIESALRFMSIVGTQQISFPEGTTAWEKYQILIQGATISQVNELKQNLTEALSQNLEEIINILGEDIVSKYFHIHEINP